MSLNDDMANEGMNNQELPERQPAKVGTTRAPAGGQTSRRIAKGLNKGINVFNGVVWLVAAGLCLLATVLTIGHGLVLPGIVFLAGTVWFLYRAWSWLTA